MRAVEVSLVLFKMSSAGKSFLLQQWDSGARQFQLIGGALEEGETPVEAAKREIWEELNLEPKYCSVKQLNERPIVATAPSPTNLELTNYTIWLFSAKVVGTSLRLTEIERWINVDKLLQQTSQDAESDRLYELIERSLPAGFAGLGNSIDDVPARPGHTTNLQPTFAQKLPRNFGLHITGPSATGKTGIVASLASAFPRMTLINSDKFYLFDSCRIGSAPSSLNDKISSHFYGVLGRSARPWNSKLFVAKVGSILGRKAKEEPIIVEGCSFSYNSLLAQARLPLTSVALRWPDEFDLRRHIERRTWEMIRAGLLDETRHLSRDQSAYQYLINHGIYYRNLMPVINGSRSIREAVRNIVEEGEKVCMDQLRRYLAVPGLRWIRSDPNDPDVALQPIVSLLNQQASIWRSDA